MWVSLKRCILCWKGESWVCIYICVLVLGRFLIYISNSIWSAQLQFCSYIKKVCNYSTGSIRLDLKSVPFFFIISSLLTHFTDFLNYFSLKMKQYDRLIYWISSFRIPSSYFTWKNAFECVRSGGKKAFVGVKE